MSEEKECVDRAENQSQARELESRERKMVHPSADGLENHMICKIVRMRAKVSASCLSRMAFAYILGYSM